MRPFADFLLVHTPLLGVVDADPRWAAKVLDTACATWPAGSAPPRLTWSLTRGWVGAADLIHTTGLTQPSGHKPGDPVMALGQFRDWLGGEARDGRAHGFAGGVVALHDIAGFLGQPAIVRGLFDLRATCEERQATAVLFLVERLPATHPLAAGIIQVPAGGDPVARYGEQAEALAEIFGAPGTGPTVAAALAGLSLTEAEAVLQLVALDRAHGGDTIPLSFHVRQLRDDLRLPPVPTADSRSLNG